MSSGFPASGNNQPETCGSSNDTEQSYNSDIIYGYSGIPGSSYPDYYGQPVQDPGSSLGALNVAGTDLLSWAQIDHYSNLMSGVDSNLGSIPPILPQVAR